MKIKDLNEFQSQILLTKLTETKSMLLSHRLPQIQKENLEAIII